MYSTHPFGGDESDGKLCQHWWLCVVDSKDGSVPDSDSDNDVGVIVATARKHKQGIDRGAHASEAKNSESAPVNMRQFYTCR